jgi:hypothetical protein
MVCGSPSAPGGRRHDERRTHESIVELSERIDAMEEKSVANMTVFNDNLNFLLKRLDAIDAKVEGLTHPIVVDKDGEVIEVTDALVSMFDGFQASVKAEVAEVKTWFQQHIDDHAKNGGRPAQANLKQLNDFIDRNI